MWLLPQPCVLTSTCTSPHTGEHFFNMVWFVRFGFEMYFAPHSRTRFSLFFDISTAKVGLNMQCFQHFDFKPKCTSDHSGMHFLSLIDLSCALATLYFDTFGPSTATKHWKNSFFARLDLLSADSFSAVSFSYLIYLTALNTVIVPVHKSENWLQTSSTLLLQYEHSSSFIQIYPDVSDYVAFLSLDNHPKLRANHWRPLKFR